MRSKNGNDRPILTDLQGEVLRTLFAEEWFADSFYLTGGTALAGFYLKHRESDDLDFFTHDPLPRSLDMDVTRHLKEAGLPVKVLQKTPGFLRMSVRESLKLDFVSDVPVRFGTPRTVEGIRVDAEENIAVNKVCAILGRLDAKDYVDLFFLVRDRGYDIADLLKKGRQKDAGLEPFTWAQLIADCENLKVLPRMRKPLALEEVQKLFREVRKDLIRSLKPE